MGDVGPILRELDRVRDAGRTVDLWWRDDDAVRATPALDRLLGLSEACGCPLAVAAIPALVEASLVERLDAAPEVRVLPHGLRHESHAAPGAKPAEFGADRAVRVLKAEASEALRLIEAAFADQALAVFVPPWNRIAPGLAAALPDIGYLGLSAFGAGGKAPGFARIDTHLDPVDWRGSRSLVAPEALAAALRRALDSGATSIGLLTHHLVFDASLWAFCGRLLDALAGHPAVRFRALSDLVRVSPSRDCNGPRRQSRSRDGIGDHAR